MHLAARDRGAVQPRQGHRRSTTCRVTADWGARAAACTPLFAPRNTRVRVNRDPLAVTGGTAAAAAQSADLRSKLNARGQSDDVCGVAADFVVGLAATAVKAVVPQALLNVLGLFKNLRDGLTRKKQTRKNAERLLERLDELEAVLQKVFRQQFLAHLTARCCCVCASPRVFMLTKSGVPIQASASQRQADWSALQPILDRLVIAMDGAKQTIDAYTSEGARFVLHHVALPRSSLRPSGSQALWRAR